MKSVVVKYTQLSKKCFANTLYPIQKSYQYRQKAYPNQNLWRYNSYSGTVQTFY